MATRNMIKSAKVVSLTSQCFTKQTAKCKSKKNATRKVVVTGTIQRNSDSNNNNKNGNKINKRAVLDQENDDNYLDGAEVGRVVKLIRANYTTVNQTVHYK